MKSTYLILLMVICLGCKDRTIWHPERSNQDADTAKLKIVAPVDWQIILDYKLDSVRKSNIKIIEHIYMNAWIDGANAIIKSVNDHQHLGNYAITQLSVKDSTIFSNDFRKRNGQ